MPQFHPAEIELCRKIYESRECVDLEVSASISKGVGITLLQGGRTVGWWYVAANKLCYAAFPGAGPVTVAAEVDQAVRSTAEMARKGLWRRPLEAASGLVAL